MGEIVRALGRVPSYSGATEFNCLVWHLINSGDVTEAAQRARADRTTPSNVLEVLEKAAVGAGSLTDPNWSALGVGRQILAGYVDTLAGISFFDRVLADRAFVPAELGNKIAIATDTAVGGIVNEGQITPIMNFAYVAVTIPVVKAIAPVILSKELARQREQMGWIGQRLRSRLVAAVDTAVMNTIIAAATSTPTSGTSVGNLATDVGVAFAAVEKTGTPRWYFALNHALAASLSARLAGSVGWSMTPSGGTLAGVPVVVSAGVPTGDLVLVDAARFAAVSEGVTLDQSTQANVQMQSTPDSPSTGATVQISLFEQNLVGVKAVQYFGLVALTNTAAAVITGMS